MRWCSTSSRSSPSCWRCSSWPRKGLHLSIEFTGGTVMEVSYAAGADI
jgi:preprotein translocase subunit SecF